MSASARQQRIAALRDSIADIERKPLLQQAAVASTASAGGFACIGPGLVQEVFTDERRNGTASLGFALGLARDLLAGPRRVIAYLQLAKDSQELGVPYGAGLASLGVAPEQVVLIRPADMVELLWAAEEALACRGVAAVVADIAGAPKILDFTASRRLSLRASAGGASFFLLRYGLGREASAAHLRWHISGALSGEMPFDARAPGEVRWLINLEKGAVAGTRQKQWLLGWTEHGFHIVDSAADGAASVRAGAPLFGAAPAALGHRLRHSA